MGKTDQILRRLTSSLKEEKKKPTAYDTQAVVRRIEGGTAWVHIPGGVDETPVRMTIDAKVGDTVQVRVGGGRAHLTGNATAPPTDDTTAKRAVKQISVTNKVLNTVKVVAERANRIAGNTNQYFWHTETGGDTGAHITEIPQEDFLADPSNGGPNLLARSNGIAVRIGTDEYATFSATDSQIGLTSEGHVITDSTGISFCDSSGTRARMEYNSGTGMYELTGNVNIAIQSGGVLLQAKNSSASAAVLGYVSGTVGVLDLSGDHIYIGSTAPIVKQTYTATSLSAGTYYLTNTFSVTKSGYTVIGANARTNQADVVAMVTDMDNGDVRAVSTSHTNISGLNLYLDVTYARSELL